MRTNISFDFAKSNLSRSEKRFLLLRFFRMLLHSITKTGVICIAPQELPLTAFTLPRLSTWIMAFITGSQSNPSAVVLTVSESTAFSALNTGEAPATKINNTTNLKILNIITWFVEPEPLLLNVLRLGFGSETERRIRIA